MLKADAGFVCWDASPPLGELWSVHRRTIIDAVYVGLSFCQTDTRDEWCVLGATVFALIRAHADFVQCEAAPCDPLVFVGRLKTVSVYIPSMASLNGRGKNCVTLPGNEFFVGVAERCARGLVRNEPAAMSTPALINW